MEKHFEFDLKKMYTTEIIAAAIYIAAALISFILIVIFSRTDKAILKIVADIFFVAFLYLICDIAVGAIGLIIKRPVKTLDLYDDHFMINDDKYFYSVDTLTYADISRSLFPFLSVEGYSLRAFDENSGIRKDYWVGPRFGKKNNEFLKTVIDALAEARKARANAYLDSFYKKSSSASQSHIVVTYPVALTQKDLILRVYIHAAFAIALFAISLFYVADVFMFLLLLLACAGCACLMVYYLRKNLFYDKNGISSSEISPKGIRINNDFYSFDLKPVFTYSDLPDKNKKIALLPAYKEMKAVASDGKIRVYSLGFDHFCFREQMLMQASIDSLMKYIEAYGIPKDY